MSLADLIKKRSVAIATATPATVATLGEEMAATVARVATVAVANPENRKAEAHPLPAPLTAPEQAAISAWLAHIEETDPAAIAEVLTRCELDAGARDYFLGRARQAPQERAEQLLAQAPATQTHAYAVLYPDADPVLVGVAVRGKGSCTLAVPADRYDPFKLLELVGQCDVRSILNIDGEAQP